MTTQQLGKYTLIRKLASGGMAEVHLAATQGPGGFQKSLVVKRIHPHLAEDERFVAMFLDEARLAAMLSHPNIVQIFDFGVAEGRYFLAMELVDGVNLRTLMQAAGEQKRSLDPLVCARLISLACEGLAYAHEFRDPSSGEALHLVHRDVSPDNLLLARNGSLKVADFGIARSDSATSRTNAGLVKGKLTYMAPEQLQAGALSPRTDLYALGVVLYELLTGALPYEGPAENEIIAGLLTNKRVPVTARRAETPPALVRILERLLAQDPADRFGDCRELANELETFIGSSGRTISSVELGKLVADLVPGPSLSAERPALKPIPLTAAAAPSQPEDAFAKTTMRHSDAAMKAFNYEDLDSPYEFSGGRSLSSDGTVEGLSETADALPMTSDAEPFELDPIAPPPPAAFRPAEPEDLELAEIARPMESAPEEMKPLDSGVVLESSLRRRRRFFIAGAVVLVAAGVGMLALPGMKRVETELKLAADSSMPAQLLIIDSEPSGAQVRISGQSIGNTPLAIDNVWPASEVPFELRLKGYKPWTGSFRGREAQRIEARLKR